MKHLIIGLTASTATRPCNEKEARISAQIEGLTASTATRPCNRTPFSAFQIKHLQPDLVALVAY